MKTNLKALLFGLTIALILGEVVVRVSGKYETWSESNGYNYESNYQVPSDQGWYMTWSPNQEVCVEKEEFNYCKQANSIGLIEREIPKKKSPDTIRVFVFGDSFAEGAGAPVDSSWVRICENELNNSDTMKVEVFNIGTSASDPIWNLKLFEGSLSEYETDLVLLTINETDVHDIFGRLAYERFLSGGKVMYRKSPWFEPLYEHSYVVRLICHELLFMNHMLLRPSENHQVSEYGMDGIRYAIQNFRNICREKGYHFGVVFTPLRDNIKYDIHPFEALSLELSTTGIPTLNVQQKFLEKQLMIRENAHEYYWPIDGHFNSKGYALVGEEVAAWLRQGELLSGERAISY